MGMIVCNRECPFCGGRNLTVHRGGVRSYDPQVFEKRIECENCGALGPVSNSIRNGLDNASRKWDERADDKVPQLPMERVVITGTPRNRN